MTDLKVALVTGAGRKRVGWHVAQALADRDYALVIHYRTSAHEAETTRDDLAERGVKAIAIRADLTEEHGVRAMVAKVLGEFGRIDVLVNCAGLWKKRRLEDVSPTDVREHFEVNTLGTFLCCQHVGLAMVRQPWGGAIINLGDWAEVRPYLDYAAYFPSKGGVTALTRSFAVELAARNPNVRVNAILPGPVMLPVDLSEAERTEAIAGTLVKREGRPENVAQAVLFFIDNDFVTGTCLPVDGGRSINTVGHQGGEL